MPNSDLLPISNFLHIFDCPFTCSFNCDPYAIHVFTLAIIPSETLCMHCCHFTVLPPENNM